MGEEFHELVKGPRRVEVKRSLYVDIDDVYAEWLNLDRKLADLHEIID